jgi:NitT/TauT family transport system permease protein
MTTSHESGAVAAAVGPEVRRPSAGRSSAGVPARRRPWWARAGAGALHVLTEGRLASFVVILVVWQLITVVTGVSAIAMPPPTAVASSWWDVLRNGDLLGALGNTLGAFLLGFLASVVVGVPVGLGMGMARRFRYVVDPYVTILLGTPFVAFVPVLLLWTGLGVETRIAAAFLFSVAFVIVNTEAGVREVSASLVGMARSYEATPMQTFRKVVLPGSLASIMVGLRLGMSHGFKGVVIAELLISDAGLGGLVSEYGGAFRTDHLLAVVFTGLAIVLLINALCQLLAKRLLPWRPVNRQQV